MNNPLFQSHADATLERVRATYAQRGNEYGDTWRNSQHLALKATAKKLGITIPEEYMRALAAAVLVDVKYQRLEGGYKDDSVVDGIAYQSLWAEEMQILTRAEAPIHERFLDLQKDWVMNGDRSLNGNGNGHKHYTGQHTLAVPTQSHESAQATPSV